MVAVVVVTIMQVRVCVVHGLNTAGRTSPAAEIRMPKVRPYPQQTLSFGQHICRMVFRRPHLTLLALIGALTFSAVANPVLAASKKTTKRRVAVTTTAKAQTPATTTFTATFTAQVWADNWFSLSVNGKVVGEDSVPVTTERSFNAETITFTASYPFTVAIEAKDFKQTDSGIEYIGKSNQQTGDGGIVAQITDKSTGKVVAVTASSWKALVIHRAPLNTSCAKDPDPDATCRFASKTAPSGWTEASFDDSAWAAATVWSAADVGPKGGYDDISWVSSAKFIWGSDLFVDNTVLLRSTVVRPS
jgi:hypothetical protein